MLKRLRVRIIFAMQKERFMCFFTWLIALSVLAIGVVAYYMHKNTTTGGHAVQCAPDGDHWIFADCSARLWVQFLHVFTTMQCGAMARVVFIKSIKKVENSETFSTIDT